jgi:methylenetetrahydrofolate dehydrogenase (NADP+)/methenyltetrahydrofolate cyclohydrolase
MRPPLVRAWRRRETAKPLPFDARPVTTAERLAGEPVATEVRRLVDGRRQVLAEHGVTPTLGTVLASDDPADEQFLSLKHDAAAALGIETRDVRVDPGAPETRLVEAVSALGADPAVHGLFVQVPLPGHVDPHAVRSAVPPAKDVDCFSPVNLGRLVAGEPRFVPATPAAVMALLEHYEVPTVGQDAVVVGRSSVIGRPLFNLLFRRADPGNATVTACHSRTRNLGAKTRDADLVVTAAGQPGLVDGSMLADGATVVDVSATRTTVDGATSYVGDVDFESAAAVVDAITPVPGGVGPVTVAMLMQNTVLAAERATEGLQAETAGWPS